MSPPRARKSTEPTVMKVDWPAGPRYWEVVGSTGARAWVDYKLYAADWYLARLDSLFEALSTVDHQLGVEMAIDGVLQALCSAVDAAAGGVIEAAELDNPPLKATEPQDYDLRLAATRLRQAGRLKAARAVDVARVDQRAESPTGWLTQLQRLRNVAAHQTTLVRQRGVGEPGEMAVIAIPGLGTRDPREYLRDVREKVAGLVGLLLGEVDRFTPPGRTVRASSGDPFTPGAGSRDKDAPIVGTA